MGKSYDDTTSMLATTDRQAREAFTAGDYALLEIGGQHSLSVEEIRNAGYEFSSYEKAAEFLREHGGGWTFDTNLDAHWHAPDEG